MRTLFSLVCITVLTITTNAQKKKPAVPLATFENCSLELKDGKLLFLQKEGKTVKLTLEIQPTQPNFAAEAAKITAFNTGGTKLYAVSWTEKTLQKTADKTEDIVALHSRIIDLSRSKVVFTNTQITNTITEKVYLDKNKTASETQMKVRREGMELQLRADGTLIQKNKTQTTQWTYDGIKGEFVVKR